jgi:hypothetical protein
VRRPSSSTRCGCWATLQLVSLLARHGRDVGWVAAGGLFVLLLLQLPTVDELNVTDRRSSSFGRLPCSDAGSQSGEHVGPIVVEREDRTCVPRGASSSRGYGTSPNTEAVQPLREQVRGRVITAADAGYDEARMVHNGIFDGWSVTTKTAGMLRGFDFCARVRFLPPPPTTCSSMAARTSGRSRRRHFRRRLV